MIVNPYEIRLSSVRKKYSSEDAINIIINELALNHADLVSAVYEKKIEADSLAAEINKIKSEKGITGIPTKKIIASLFRYGILEPYVTAPDITDVFGNSFDNFSIKQKGKIIRIPERFATERDYVNYLQRIAIMNGKRLNQNEAEIICTDRERNLRIVISIKPIALKSPFLVIRKPSTGRTLDELIDEKMLDKSQAQYLTEAVRERKSIIIAGRGGSGKTTLLSALIKEIPVDERVLLIQETAEIMPSHPNILCTTVRLTENENLRQYPLFELTKDGLLMSLDRLIIGEMKDKEAMDFFNAIYTGHRGSMATVHSNSAEETIPRLILLMKRGTDINEKVLQEILGRSLDVVVYLRNYKIAEITEIKTSQNGGIQYCSIFQSSIL